MKEDFPSCTPNEDTYPYGSEPWINELRVELPERCNDCAVVFGATHHFFCDVAACKPCDAEQYLFCDHFADEADRLGIQPPTL